MRTRKTFLATIALVVGITTVGIGNATADPKPDALSSTGKWYSVDMDDACRVQYSYSRNSLDGSIYAAHDVFSGAYGWYCARDQWSVSLPAGIGFTVDRLGSIDVQQYCDTFYRGTRAADNGFHWFCDKRP